MYVCVCVYMYIYIYTHSIDATSSACVYIYMFRTKLFLEQSGCRTRQPGRTWLLGPGAVLVLIQDNT